MTTIAFHTDTSSPRSPVTATLSVASRVNGGDHFDTKTPRYEGSLWGRDRKWDSGAAIGYIRNLRSHGTQWCALGYGLVEER